MQLLKSIHHISIVCSNYEVSKKFYTETLGLQIILEHYRAERHSYKLDLALDDQYVIELFSFPNPPPRTSRPEACGLRHIAFEVIDLDASILDLSKKGVITEPIRTDEFTGKRFTFFSDPNELPIELYER